MYKIYNYKLDNKYNAKIALISDLHEHDPKEALETLKEIKPDMILFPGDLMERRTPHAIMADGTESPWNFRNMNEFQLCSYYLRFMHKITRLIAGDKSSDVEPEIVECDEEKVEYSHSFLLEANKIAPLILSVGNHEWYYTKEDMEAIKKSGTVLLDNGDIEYYLNGKRILIGGLSTRRDDKWLHDFLKKDGYKILLCHHPEYVKSHVLPFGKSDIIVSGHAHGGQWRIGKLGGYAPGQGFFPRLVHGVYKFKNGSRLVLTSGTGNQVRIPRLGNPPEVIVIEI